jgi:hypothetical protein
MPSASDTSRSEHHTRHRNKHGDTLNNEDELSRSSSDYSDDASDEHPPSSNGSVSSYEYINVDEGRFSSSSSSEGWDSNHDEKERMLMQRRFFNEDKGSLSVLIYLMLSNVF